MADENLQKKRLVLARLYYKKYLTIIKEEDKEKASLELGNFIEVLEGHEKFKKLFLKPVVEWTKDDKLLLIKYRLKYALRINDICNNYMIRKDMLCL